MSIHGNLVTRVWLGLFLVYIAFFYWYTSFGGPLTSEEIVHYRAAVEKVTDVDSERIAVWQHFMETDTGDDFGMISAIDMRETPTQIEGVEPGESSDEVLAMYSEPFFGDVLRLEENRVDGLGCCPRDRHLGHRRRK